MGEEEGGEIVADRPSVITTTLNAGRVQSWLSDRITNAALNSRRSLPDRQFGLRWMTKDAGNGQTCRLAAGRLYPVWIRHSVSRDFTSCMARAALSPAETVPPNSLCRSYR